MNYLAPKERGRNKAFQTWLLEGEPSFEHSAVIAVKTSSYHGHASLFLHDSTRLLSDLSSGIELGAHVPPDATDRQVVYTILQSIFSVDGALRKPDPDLAGYTHMIEIPLRPNQYQTLLADIEYTLAHHHPYNAPDIMGKGTNCMSFCLKMLNDVGINVRELLPTRTLTNGGIIPRTLRNAINRTEEAGDVTGGGYLKTDKNLLTIKEYEVDNGYKVRIWRHQ